MSDATTDVPNAIRVSGLNHFYGSRQALRDLNLQIHAGEIFVFLGPNGGGKTTLFRVLSTLIPCQRGNVSILGFSLPRDILEIRRRIGVVFQAPSLDKKLTVSENICLQAALYGVGGTLLRDRQQSLMEQLGIAGRADERTETLSGGLRRRVELAKGMIHQPRLLLLDEPSTGLDPGARADLWRYLQQLRDDSGVSIVMTTHLLDEAERADRIAILDRGTMVALDTPDCLRASIGGDTITIESDAADSLAAAIRERFDIGAGVVGGRVRLEHPDASAWVARIVEAFSVQVRSITLAKPTLEDVFIQKTGHRFWQEQEGVT
ncbi:MAG: ABC transporter ATP-binding protein [Planctomycetaceae bacterium]|nr:ABC transporter ATP-binding protein [Planctomycetales bacterium]MCB9927420.1 ABC transporter ATP-binding protein [Planctomycetaceae bacterium]